MALLDFGGYLLLALAALAFLLVQSWLAATVVRRVLGVPTGWPRTFLVGLVMSTVMAFTVQYLFRAATGQNTHGLDVNPPVAALILVVATGWIFALGVGALVMIEVAFPTGTVPGPQALLFGWKARRRRARRYRRIITILTRNGLASYLRGFRHLDSAERAAKTARALRDSLSEAGVTFVKLGQMLSTRRDLLPPPFIRELETLQTQVAAESWESIEAAIERSLGADPSTVFSHIDPAPLAAASVAQVHRGRLLDGSEVILKIQRPHARQQVALDLDIIHRLARWLQRTTVWGRNLGVEDLAVGFSRSLTEELDYRIELENMRNVEATTNRSGDFTITVPHAYDRLSSEHLLIMDRLPGRPVSSAGALLADRSPKQRTALASDLLGVTLHQIVSTGTFHADLHPGNVFITPDGGLGLLDFGSVGRLDPATRSSLGLMLYSIEANDSAGATDCLLEVLTRPDNVDLRALERSVGELLTHYRGGGSRYSGQKLFDDLFSLVVAHGFAVPAQIGAAFRALATVEGTVTLIDPRFDVVEAARTEGSRLVRDKITQTDYRAEFERRALQILPMIDRLPRRLNKIGEDLEHGRFSMNIRVLENPSDRRFLTSLFQQLIVSVLAGSAVLGAILLIISDTGPVLTDGLRLYSFFGFILLFGGFVLSMRSLMLVFKRGLGR